MPRQPGKRKKARGAKRRRRRSQTLPAVLVLAVFVLTIVAAVAFLSSRIGRRQAGGPSQTGRAAIPYEEPAPSHITVIPANGSKHRPPPGPRRPRLPLVAIIIDDMGYNLDVGRRLIESGMNLTFAFLPDGPHTAELAALAQRYHRDRLLHFPMEPASASVNPGPGAVYLDTPYADMRRIFFDNLAVVPGVIGINNHMGSRFTQNEAAMREFLGLVSAQGIFFVDSITSANSVGYSLAREMGVPTARRDVFLDNVQAPEAIARQLAVLAKIAARHGSAVGIGHPHRATLAALTSRRRWLASRMTLVGVARLVH